ncbi:hypothetical protein NP493_44g04019 [Ridgeia piscesae]|uniref:Uncharacterized protein n=1 Tax=Ridgeia piscesae TaxID=27915 RepID=A0AAD9UJH1_RIDPI|nr:hypothetical protein NP493_44g04019 [Ridgeia piscesae]
MTRWFLRNTRARRIGRTCDTITVISGNRVYCKRLVDRKRTESEHQSAYIIIYMYLHVHIHAHTDIITHVCSSNKYGFGTWDECTRRTNTTDLYEDIAGTTTHWLSPYVRRHFLLCCRMIHTSPCLVWRLSAGKLTSDRSARQASTTPWCTHARTHAK